MNDQDWMDALAAPEPPFSFGPLAAPGVNGFDFGLSQPKTGLGYGLLGDARSLVNGQTCADCPPSDPCPNCSGDDTYSGADPPVRIIKAQVPIPMPGLFPPPPIITPPHPPQPIIIGDPNAWWNWTLDQWADWLGGRSETRKAEQAIELKCESQLGADYQRCEAIARRATAEAGPERGARELDSCKRQAGTRYAECLRNKGEPKSPAYPDWYDDPPYPDDFDNPYPKKS